MLTPVLAQNPDYIVTNIGDSKEFWIFPNEPLFPKVRGNLTSSEEICKVERRILLDNPRIATEDDVRKYPQDIIKSYQNINNYLIYCERELVGYYKCNDIFVNQTNSNQSQPQVNGKEKKMKIFKTLLISLSIILIVIGIIYAFSLKMQRQSPNCQYRSITHP